MEFDTLLKLVAESETATEIAWLWFYKGLITDACITTIMLAFVAVGFYAIHKFWKHA